jgi:hypothetical protein
LKDGLFESGVVALGLIGIDSGKSCDCRVEPVALAPAWAKSDIS